MNALLSLDDVFAVVSRAEPQLGVRPYVVEEGQLFIPVKPRRKITISGFFFVRNPVEATQVKSRGNDFWPFENEFWQFGNEFWAFGNEFLLVGTEF